MVDQEKRLLILIGPKGSGKTYIGRLLEQKLGIHFLHVEPIFIQNAKNTDVMGPKWEKQGFNLVELYIIVDQLAIKKLLNHLDY